MNEQSIDDLLYKQITVNELFRIADIYKQLKAFFKIKGSICNNFKIFYKHMNKLMQLYDIEFQKFNASNHERQAINTQSFIEKIKSYIHDEFADDATDAGILARSILQSLIDNNGVIEKDREMIVQFVNTQRELLEFAEYNAQQFQQQQITFLQSQVQIERLEDFDRDLFDILNDYIDFDNVNIAVLDSIIELEGLIK